MDDRENPEVVEILNDIGLIEDGSVALNEIMTKGGFNQQDAVNRALQAYAFVMREQVYTKEERGFAKISFD